MNDVPHSMPEKFVIRMPDGMRARIKIAAARNGRSMNSEILDTLEDRYPEPANGGGWNERLLSRAARIADEPVATKREAALRQFQRELEQITNGETAS